MFHWTRLSRITMITGMTRNSSTPIRLGSNSMNAVRVLPRSAAWTAAVRLRLGNRLAAEVATLIAPPGDRTDRGPAAPSCTLDGRFHHYGNAASLQKSRAELS